MSTGDETTRTYRHPPLNEEVDYRYRPRVGTGSEIPLLGRDQLKVFST